MFPTCLPQQVIRLCQWHCSLTAALVGWLADCDARLECEAETSVESKLHLFTLFSCLHAAIGTALAQLAGFLCEAAWPCLVDWLAGWLSGAPFPGCTLLAGLADPGWLAGCLAAGCLGLPGWLHLAGWVGRAWLAIQPSTHGQLNGQLKHVSYYSLGFA